MSKRFTLGRFLRAAGKATDPVVCRLCAKLGGGRETVIAVAMIELLERRTLLPVVHLGQVNGNGTTTVVVNNSLVVGNFSQAALLNNGTVEIDGAGAIGQLTGSGNLTIGNGTSNNTVQLAPGATPDGVNNTQTSLTVSPGSTLDITNNTLLLNYGSGSTPLAAVQAAVASGAGVAGASGAYGAIVSSTAQAGGLDQFAVGYADATEEITVPTGNVKVMYTLVGDALLTGTVGVADYSAIENNYNLTGTDWSQGDFNHDGTVDYTDFALFENNFGQTVSSAPVVTVVPTVTYTLSVNDDGTGHYEAGYFAVYVTDSGNSGGNSSDTNAGLANYAIFLSGAATITNYSPKGFYDDGTGCGTDDAIGFTFVRSGNNISPVTACEDTVDYAIGSGVILVYGVGQTAGNLASDAPPGGTGADGSTTQPLYGAPLLLIKGTFNGSAPTFTNTGGTVANAFVGNSGCATEAATIVFDTVVISS